MTCRLEVETLDYAEVAQFAMVEWTEKPVLGKIARYIIRYVEIAALISSW